VGDCDNSLSAFPNASEKYNCLTEFKVKLYLVKKYPVAGTGYVHTMDGCLIARNYECKEGMRNKRKDRGEMHYAFDNRGGWRAHLQKYCKCVSLPVLE
jgi:hypothetical protein